MSALKINIQSKTTNFSIYSKLLRKAIEEVSCKINVDVSDITWYIVSEKDLQDTISPYSIINSNLTPIAKKYGRCNIKKKEVEISTDAIQNYKINDTLVVNKLLFQTHLKPNRILLIDVLMDEIAHIVSKKSHGDNEYEKLLASYHQLFYQSKL